MTPAERRALLGDAVIERIHREVAETPAPSEDVIASLRMILTRPAGCSPTATQATAA
ncbi:hypothetical protein [Streptomyces mobaraensis]|uniref:hypothetical protein n=1 Tax=Streptomyces mobaraensis TaxID=35621 RepID=UPI0012ACDD98|nr:hypothetical protein [Streptomyces mobaraensis]